MNTIEAAFDWRIDEVGNRSRELFSEAIKYTGRGAFLYYLNSVTDLISNSPMSLRYISQSQLNQLTDDATLHQFMEEYDPRNQFVLYIMVCISKERQKAGLPDSCTRCIIVHRDSYKLKPSSPNKTRLEQHRHTKSRNMY